MGENHLRQQLATKVVGTALRILVDAPKLLTLVISPMPHGFVSSNNQPTAVADANRIHRTDPLTTQAVEA